ncbi:MAG: hypothetical protein KAR57_01140 [Bacteroidales bacterium]|nr:hypothetical protein [Bacteroidales bacterium]
MTDLTKHSLYKPMEVDSMLSAIFSIYLKKFLTMFIYSFVAVFIIQIILYYLGFMDLYNVSDPEELMRNLPEIFKKMGVVSVSSFIIYGFLNAFLVNYLIKSDLNPDAVVGELFAESVRKFSVHMIFFLVLSAIIIVIGVFFGVFAIIIGSIVAMAYLGTIMMSGGAILVAEEKNAIETVARAFTLTHKDFWSALGTVVLFVLIMFLVSLVLTALIAIPFVIMFFGNLNETGSILEALDLKMYDIGLWTVVLNSIVAALTYPLYATLSVVLYFKLKYTEDQKAANSQ